MNARKSFCTNQVTAVDYFGATVQGTHIPWLTLRAAAEQDDAELSETYAWYLGEALEIAGEQSPVEILVAQDHTNVWWRVSVRTLWGRTCVSGFTRLANEGGGHTSKHTAELEAKDIARRLRMMGRVVKYSA